ncbi:PKD-like domain-containing protein, partial [Flavobacterium terrigena]|uniref:PKD-like domain-containing protein n=1 Tax=Flavobacterium terrigena TaxID=402734 RepID=UPI0039F0B870
MCNGGTLNIASQLTSTVTGATFVWSASTYNVNTIEASSGTIIHNGNQSNIDLIVNLIDPYVGGNVTIQVRPEIGNCSGTPQEIVITVKPIPAILPNQTVADKPVICNNEFVTITTHSNPVATLYTWQV